MAGPTNSGAPSSGKEGLIDHLRALAASAAAYAGARLQLAGLESREAAVHYAKIVAWLVAAACGLAFGYIFLCLAVVFILHHFLKTDWMWILLGVAVVHFLGAVIAIFIAKSKLPKAVFAATIAEFKKDQSWLETPSAATRRN